MRPRTEDSLLRALKAPAMLASVPPCDWYPLLAAARQSALIGTLAVRTEHPDLRDTLPPAVRDSLVAAERLAAHHDGMLRWEANRIARALGDIGEPFLLLKGAAYAMLGLPSSRGRLTGDIDILVRRSALGAVEAQLMAHGWEAADTDPYDQRYYRDYMHELPPLRHRERGTVVDVHHTISPPTSRIKIDGDLLWPEAQAIAETAYRALSPADLVLHAMIHLFHEGSIASGLRDLYDIDGLLRHYGEMPGFWERLAQRAGQFGAGRMLFYGLRYAELLLDTPIPETAWRSIDRRWRPASGVQAVMDRLVVEALLSHRGTAASRRAAWLLFVRSHWRRMPPLMLTAHLLRKAARRWRAAETAEFA